MIELLIYTCFWIWGVAFAFKHGQILGRIGDEIDLRLPRWFYKISVGCCPCMSSFHGILSFAVFSPLFSLSIWLMPIFVICLIGLNHIITAFIYDLE